MKTILITLFCTLTAISIPLTASAETARIRTGSTLPSVTGEGLNGERIVIPSGTRGNVTVIHFWAVGCSSCREEMPDLERLYRSLARRGLSILAVNVGQPRRTVQEGVKGIGVTYPVVLDPDRRISSTYEVVGIPRTIVLDRTGIVRYKIIGSVGAHDLKRFIETLL